MIDISNIQDTLKTNIVNISFTKVDGTARTMKATLKPEMLPETKGNGKINDDVVTVFSIEDQGWRSFRKDSFISAEIA
jgi:tRNA A37 threonylcarbamoyladenosine dehydratase